MDVKSYLDDVLGVRVEAFVRSHRAGLVTVLFSDFVERETSTPDVSSDTASAVELKVHDDRVRALLAQFEDSEEIASADGSFFIVFIRPSDAFRFALRLLTEDGGSALGPPLRARDRVGIHVGEMFEASQSGIRKDLYALQVNIGVRLASLAVGGQVLSTRAAFDNARQMLRGEPLAGIRTLRWLNHGYYQVQGLEEPLEICAVGEAGVAPLDPPKDSTQARRRDGHERALVLGWRPAPGQEVPGTGWEIARKLGEGGFGEVWLGRHAVSKQERVFKFCFQVERVRALKREVSIWTLLKERLGAHPRIVPLRMVNLDEPPFYIMMDYAAGQDLGSWFADRERTHGVPIETRLEVLAQAAEALAAAHAAGVLHRDVKPGNILVEEPVPGDVQVRLADFGIGVLLNPEYVAAEKSPGFTMTMSGTGDGARAGTQIYMAPELWSGGKSSPASDFYALGIVMHQLLSSDFKRPIGPHWEKQVAEPALQSILRKLVAPDPNERTVDGATVAATLREAGSRIVCDSRGEIRQVKLRRILAGCLLFPGTAMLAVGILGILWTLLGPLADDVTTGLPRDLRAVFVSTIGIGGAMLAAAFGRASMVSVLGPALLGALLGIWQFLLESPQTAARAAWWILGAGFLWIYARMVCTIALGVGGIGRQRHTDLGNTALDRSLANRWGAVIPLIAVSLIVAAYGIENWRGQRAWAGYEAEMRERGAPATIADLARKPVAAALNFCVAPGVPRLIGYGDLRAEWKLQFYPDARSFPLQLSHMKLASEEDSRSQSLSAGWRLPNGERVRDFAINVADLDRALTTLLEGQGQQFQIEESLRETLRSGMTYYKVPFRYDRAAVRTQEAFDEFLARYALRVRAQPTNATLVIGLRPCTPQAVLDWYRRWERNFADLREATVRPHADPGWVYLPSDVIASFPNLVLPREISQNIANHATAALLAGDSETATLDLVAILRIAQACSKEPSLTGSMVSVAIVGLASSVAGEWLQEGLLGPRQLDRLQTEFARFDLLATLRNGLLGERVRVMHSLRKHDSSAILANVLATLPTFGANVPAFPVKAFVGGLASASDIGPAGWKQQGAVIYGRWFDAAYFDKWQTTDGQHFFRSGRATSTLHPPDNLFSPYQWSLFGSGLALMNTIVDVGLVPSLGWSSNFHRTLEVAARNQALIGQMVVACGLAKFHLENDRYPERLDELAPKHLQRAPIDPIGGGTLRYRRIGTNSYVIYSMGWDGIDQGGQAAASDWSALTSQTVDWVFQGGAKTPRKPNK